jgi:hypothetical protein
MMCVKIFSPGFRNYLRGITYATLLCFLLSFSSCYTLTEETITPEDLEYMNDYSVLAVNTKSDSTINLEDYDVSYVYISDSAKGVLKCVGKTASSDITSHQYKKAGKLPLDIHLDSVSKIKIEKSKYDPTAATLVTVGVVAGTLIVAGIVVILWVNAADETYHVLVPGH